MTCGGSGGMLGDSAAGKLLSLTPPPMATSPPFILHQFFPEAGQRFSVVPVLRVKSSSSQTVCQDYLFFFFHLTEGKKPERGNDL